MNAYYAINKMVKNAQSAQPRTAGGEPPPAKPGFKVNFHPMFSPDSKETRDEVRALFRNAGWEEASPGEEVRHFYNVIVPGIHAKNKFLGKDVGGYDIRPDFWGNTLVFRPGGGDLGPRENWAYYASGRDNPDGVDRLRGYDVIVNASGGDVKLVHELKHNQHDDHTTLAGMGSYISKEDADLLGDAYPIPGRRWWLRDPYVGMLDRERRAVNAQHQFRAMKDLAGRLGRLPSHKEYDKFVSELPEEALIKYIKSPISYDRDATKDISKERLEAYRRALLEVVRNSRPRSSGAGSPSMTMPA